ncbi:MAG TPA: type IV secretory system conjugative DNA transfer family protein [Acidimicrobiales bacterium]
MGRHLLATEARQADDAPQGKRRSAAWRRSSPRWGNRGALALIGPSQSGKTTAAVAGILDWQGPAVLSSVKADLLAPTAGWRSRQGEVRVYDPTGTTGTEAVRAAWSPVSQAATPLGAQRAARALCDAAPKGNVEGGLDFWLAQAEILLSGLLFVAHHTRSDMGTVCEWVLTQDRPSDLGTGVVRTALEMLHAHEDDGVALGARDASRGLHAVWEMEDRTRSSIYATAQTVVWPWSETGVATSSGGESVDLAWLLSGSNTVYLCAPLEDQRRLAPAFGGLLNDLIAQAYRHVAATGRPLDPPLLIVIDEAGNTPLRALPEYASTLAGIGVLLVTIWQSLAQIEATYQRQADTILTNHLTKVFYAGLSDGATLRYIQQVLGDAEVETRSRSSAERFGRASIQLATTRSGMAPPHALRQMRPGDALLLHGTLPPAHVRTRPYYRDRLLRQRAGLAIASPEVEPAPRTLLGAATAATEPDGGER